MFILFVIITLFLIATLVLNAGNKLLFCLMYFKKFESAIFWFIYGIVSFVTFFVFIKSSISDRFLNINVIRFFHYLLGFYTYFLIFTFFADLILMAGRIVRLVPKQLPEIMEVYLWSFIIFISLILAVYGFYNAKNIKNIQYTVNVENSETELKELNAVLISDIHLGHIIDDKFFEKIVNEINVNNPDVVFIAGDIFDGSLNKVGNLEKVSDLFSSINTKYGVYSCMGNHDAGNTYDDMRNFLEKSKVNILEDEIFVMEDKFAVIGRRDIAPIGKTDVSRYSTEKLLLELDTELPVFVLDHQPSVINEYDNTVDLILCGHTHRGQVFPFNFITNALFDVDYGYYQKDEFSPKVIVTSGIGSWGPPIRVASNCEIVTINIQFN